MAMCEEGFIDVAPMPKCSANELDLGALGAG